MNYFVYNATKDVRLPGDFEFKDILFSRQSFGRIIRMLLDKEWSGDRIAILPVNKWTVDKDNLMKAGIKRDPFLAKEQSIYFDTHDVKLPAYIESDDSYIGFNNGSVYEVDKDGLIKRFETLVPLIAVDPPEHLYEKYYVDMNGRWAFKPIRGTCAVSAAQEDLSWKYDLENFFKTYEDDDLRRKTEGIEIPDDGLWIGDLMGLFEE